MATCGLAQCLHGSVDQGDEGDLPEDQVDQRLQPATAARASRTAGWAA